MWDDTNEIERNPVLRKGNIKDFFTISYWRAQRAQKSSVDVQLKPISPVRSLCTVLDYKIWNINPAGYHFTNLLLHIINVFLVYLLCFILTKNRIVSLFSGILFALHPMHVETVAWIKNRIDLITSILFLLTLILFIKYVEKKNVWIYLLSVFCFILSLFSKETSIAIPFVVIMYIFCFLEKTDWKSTILKTLPFWIITVLFLLFEKFVVGADKVAVLTAKNFNLLYQHVYTVFITIAYYFYLLIFPFKFCAERWLPIPESVFDLLSILSVLFVLLYAWLLFWSFKRNKLITFLLAVILLPIIPVSNIIYLSTRPIAEHRLYLPSIGFCFLVALGINWIRQRSVLVNILVLLLFSTYAVASMKRVYEWRSPVSFWESTEKNSTPNYRTYVNLGCSYLGEKRYDEALAKFALAKKIAPDDPYVLNNLGVLYIDLERYQEAKELFEKALDYYPNFEYALVNLGWCYYNFGRKAEAIKHINKAIEVNPSLSLAYIELAEIYKEDNKIENAEELFYKALELEQYPWEVHKSLIDMYEQHKMYDKAIQEYNKAIRIDPSNGWAYNGLGIVYAQIGKYEQAKECFEKAHEIYPTQRTIRKNLGEINRLLEDIKRQK